jgi:hypothetical protein
MIVSMSAMGTFDRELPIKGSALSSIAAALESYFCNTVSEITGLRNSNSSRFGGGVRRVNREKLVPAPTRSSQVM